GGDGDAQRLAEPTCNQADAVHREHGEVDAVATHPDATFRRETVVRPLGPDDDPSIERHAGERLFHEPLAGFSRARLVATTEPAPHGERGGLGGPQQLEAVMAIAADPRREGSGTGDRGHPLHYRPGVAQISPTKRVPEAPPST